MLGINFMSTSCFSWRRGASVTVGLVGLLLLGLAAMQFLDVLPSLPAHWKSQLIYTVSAVLAPGVAAIVAARLLWIRAEQPKARGILLTSVALVVASVGLHSYWWFS